MAMFADNPQRPESYERFVHPTPTWFKESGLGIFIHWGAYSVPAWAEPIGALGAVEDKEYWFAHNPYAEWYFNTIRIDGSPAALRHREIYGDAPYDDFLDAWHAEAFDPADMVALFVRAGARYVVPTTKHHDGITLWNAPGTGDRNTVKRGPHQDLVEALATATRAAGLRFGVYYSSGIDWHAAPTPPIRDEEHGFAVLPQDETYARYVNTHVVDLIDRYQPDVLWGDIGYPEAGQPDSDFSLAHVFDHFYATAPEGVINDRWGLTHWDFRTSEYEQGAAVESQNGDMWQNTRGIGYSFGYNQREDENAHLTGRQAVELLVDVVSRGGNLLLNVGPDASGRIPELQRRCLEGLADWMASNAEAIHGTGPFAGGDSSESPWIRWTSDDRYAYAIVRASGPQPLAVRADEADPSSAALLSGTPLLGREVEHGVLVELPDLPRTGPHVVRFDRR